MTTNILTRFHRSVRRFDGVALAIALILLVLTLLVPLQASASLAFTLKSLWKVIPFLLLSIGIGPSGGGGTAVGCDGVLAVFTADGPVYVCAHSRNARDSVCAGQNLRYGWDRTVRRIWYAGAYAIWLVL